MKKLATTQKTVHNLNKTNLDALRRALEWWRKTDGTIAEYYATGFSGLSQAALTKIRPLFNKIVKAKLRDETIKYVLNNDILSNAHALEFYMKFMRKKNAHDELRLSAFMAELEAVGATAGYCYCPTSEDLRPMLRGLSSVYNSGISYTSTHTLDTLRIERNAPITYR